MTLLHCTHITRSLPVFTPSHPPALFTWNWSCRFSTFVRFCVTESMCNVLSSCFLGVAMVPLCASDILTGDYCHNLASVMTGFREKRSICRGSEGTRCWNYITCVAMLPAPPCYFRPILQLLCVIYPHEFGHFISSFTLSFASKNTSKHAQKRRFWRHCEINWNWIWVSVTGVKTQSGLLILEYNMTFDKNCNHLEAQNNLKFIFWTEIQAFGVHAYFIS